MKNNMIQLIVFVPLCISMPLGANGQASVDTTKQSAPTADTSPFTTQLKKVVIAIETDCLHEPSSEELEKLTPLERPKWTPEAIGRLKPEELSAMPKDSYFGTGFIIFLPDARFGLNQGFNYIVTNRHVAEPGVEHGHPCKVVGRSFRLNHLGEGANSKSFLQTVPAQIDDAWIYPDDEAVDLAIAQFTGTQDQWDFKSIPFDKFVSQGMVDRREIVEGDPVMFSGLFIQYQGASKLDPIVRSGTVAMLPSDLINTTLGKQGRVYLLEVHVFGGNSGSPVFVAVPTIRGQLGFTYRFFGVVAGEVYETSDLTLQVATSYKGVLAANSNISMIVPAEEVTRLLNSPKLVGLRDGAASVFLSGKK